MQKNTHCQYFFQLVVLKTHSIENLWVVSNSPPTCLTFLHINSTSIALNPSRSFEEFFANLFHYQNNTDLQLWTQNPSDIGGGGSTAARWSARRASKRRSNVIHFCSTAKLNASWDCDGIATTLIFKQNHKFNYTRVSSNSSYFFSNDTQNHIVNALFFFQNISGAWSSLCFVR